LVLNRHGGVPPNVAGVGRRLRLDQDELDLRGGDRPVDHPARNDERLARTQRDRGRRVARVVSAEFDNQRALDDPEQRVLASAVMPGNAPRTSRALMNWSFVSPMILGVPWSETAANASSHTVSGSWVSDGGGDATGP